MPLEGSPSPLSRSTHPYTFGGTAANHNHNPADPHHAHHHAHHAHHHAAAAAPAAAAPATVPQLEADALRLSKEAQLQERLREQLTEDLSAPASPLPHLLGAADARSDNGSDVAANLSASADSLVADHAAPSSSSAVDTSMVVWADDELGNRQGDMTARQRDYLDAHRPLGDVPCPCLVLDLDVIRRNYEVLAASMPARVFYAVKANPAPALLEALAELGSCFDVASPGEIDCALRAGVTPDRISYGNTIKKQADIAYAYRAGVRMYAFDSSAELQKLAAAAPGSRVYCRVLVPCDGAEWPLSRKFGCEPEMAEDLLVEAARAGLVPCGVSFHVGSQQCDPTAWRSALATVARVFRNVRARGLDTVRLVNLGGGMPSRYTRDVPAVAAYTANIRRALEDLFGPAEGGMPELIFEPGRSVAGDAGVIEAEVVLISRKSHGAGERRWVYLDIGLFGGLAETMGEAIRYRVRVPPGRSRVCAPVVLAGPTCDSADIMYDKTPFNLPVDLQVGDRIQILATGAYTTTYSSVCFNGFAPLACRTI